MWGVGTEDLLNARYRAGLCRDGFVGCLIAGRETHRPRIRQRWMCAPDVFRRVPRSSR